MGILVDWLEGEYQAAIVNGVVEAAAEHAVDVVCFVGGALNSPDRFAEQRNGAYDLAASTDIDGLIILTGALGNRRAVGDLTAFCDRFRPVPMVSVAVRLKGMTSILIDGEPSLQEGIKHLVEDHEYRRIAVIGGPEGSAEARSRLQTSLAALGTYDLQPPDEFVAVGDFQYESGVEAVRTLIVERALSLDAIVVANDQMALGAIDGLRALGKRVPRDVAIIGFDDIRDARFCAPPLTTVRQPLHEQGRLALEVLLSRLRGEPVDDVVTLPTELVVRRSCGCASGTRQINVRSTHSHPLTESDTTLGADEALRLRRPCIVEALHEPTAGLLTGIEDRWDEALLDALIADLHGEDSGRFTDRVDLLLEQSRAAGGTGNAWLATLSALRREVMPCLASDPVMRSRAEDLLQEGRVLVVDAVEHARAQRRLVVERRAHALALAGEAISGALDLSSLGSVLVECLPRLGVSSGYIVLYEQPAVSLAGAETSGDTPALQSARRLVFAYDATGGTVLPDDSRPFSSETLLPWDMLLGNRPRALVIEPLYIKDDPLGYLVLEFAPFDGLVYERLREQISGVLKVALLIDQLVATGAERARLLEALQVRAGELEAAYSALKDNQDRLVSTEKMASLGRITANIAHEMNTPLAAVRTALVEIEKRALEYEASAGDDEVTAEDHAQIAAEMLAALGLARSAAERAARFVRGVKTQTRDISGQEKVRYDPTPVIEDALLLLSFDIRRASCALDFQPPAHPVELVGSPGLLSQVVTNLVTNALDAMPTGGGTITVSMSEGDGLVRLRVQDTGGGIPDDLRDKVFEPMFTTKPFGQGTGLGLAIVHDLVTGQLGGSLELESEVGIGTTFTIALPCPKVS